MTKRYCSALTSHFAVQSYQLRWVRPRPPASRCHQLAQSLGTAPKGCPSRHPHRRYHRSAAHQEGLGRRIGEVAGVVEKKKLSLSWGKIPVKFGLTHWSCSILTAWVSRGHAATSRPTTSTTCWKTCYKNILFTLVTFNTRQGGNTSAIVIVGTRIRSVSLEDAIGKNQRGSGHATAEKFSESLL